MVFFHFIFVLLLFLTCLHCSISSSQSSSIILQSTCLFWAPSPHMYPVTFPTNPRSSKHLLS